MKCIFVFCLSESRNDKKPKSGLFSKFRCSLRKPGSRKNVPMMTDDGLTSASSQCIYFNAPSSNLSASHVTGSFYPVSSSSLRRRSYLIAIDQNKSNELLERSVKPSGVMYTVDDADMVPSVNPSGVMYIFENDDLKLSVKPSGFIYTAETAGDYFETHQDEIVPIPSQKQSSKETAHGLMVRCNIEQIVRKRRSSGKAEKRPNPGDADHPRRSHGQ